MQTIQKYLITGMSREKIAEKLGYKNWHSLDIFMRRAGMRWNRELNRYYMEGEYSTSKTERIMTLFKKSDADPKQIADETGFNDHLGMAAYMASNGYSWSNEEHNYIKASDTRPKEREIEHVIEPFTAPEKQCLNALPGENKSNYKRLFDLLDNNMDRLIQLLQTNNKSFPRYTIPGITRTKSFYMSDSLSRLLNEFCKAKNLTQKEVVEAALIEFLSNHSYKTQVEKLINNG